MSSMINVAGSSIPGGVSAPPPGFSPASSAVSPPSQSGYSLSVAVEGLLFSYSLTEEDLKKVFSRYGRLLSVELLAPARQSAIVTFVHLQDAELAVRDLNNKVLTGVHGRLLVHWTHDHQQPYVPSAVSAAREAGNLDSPVLPEVFPSVSLSPSFLPPPSGSSSTPGLPGGGGYGSSPDFPQMFPGGTGEVRKYTARFEIGIENEKDFQVARRLIGVKGQHMKHINKETEAKLRLRGKGSGYLEGMSKTESPEPLHLCVSCVSQEGYKRAVSMVSELLESVYEDYRKFCKNKNIPFPSNLQVNMREVPLVAFANPAAASATGAGGGDSPALMPHDF